LKDKLYVTVLVLLASAVIYLLVSNGDQVTTEPTLEEVSSYEVPELVIPDTIFFAGERVPLEIPDVRERLDRELHVNTFWHSNTIFLLKRGNRWLPDIRKELEEAGVPSDLMYLCVIESDMKNGVSPANAVGFWQLLKGTARDFGLEVTTEVDERYHPMKSTDAAANYLIKQREKFGSWTNAAASYNIGRRGLDRAFIKQGVSSYYDLLLGEETSRYVFRAIAVKLIFEDPEKYGFVFSEDALYKKEDLEEIEIISSIDNLRDWAFDHGINYKLLKRHNPWLRKNALRVRSGKSYVFLIPRTRIVSTISTDSSAMKEELDSIIPDVKRAPVESGGELQDL